MVPESGGTRALPPPPLAKGLSPGAAALLVAAATGVPPTLRAALESAAPGLSLAEAIAAAAHACLVMAAFQPAWDDGREGSRTPEGISSPLLPPSWAPTLSAPALPYTYGAGGTSLEVRVYGLGDFTVLAGGLVGGGGRGGGGGAHACGGLGHRSAFQLSIRTAAHAAAPAGASAAADTCAPLARVRELTRLLGDAFARPLALAAAAAAAGGAHTRPHPPPPTSLLDLPPDLLAVEVLARLGGTDLAALACTCLALGGLVEEDGLWGGALRREFGDTRPPAPHGGAPHRARAAFAAAWADRQAGRRMRSGVGLRRFHPQPFPFWPGPGGGAAWVPRGGGGSGGGARRPGGVIGGDFDRLPFFVGGPFGAVGPGTRGPAFGGGGARWHPPPRG